MEGNHLFTLPNNSHTGDSFLSTQYTLRCCSKDYRQETGEYQESNDPPEFDYNRTAGKIAPLLTFDNTYGHWTEGITRVFPPCHHETSRSFFKSLEEYLEHTSLSHRLWDLDNANVISMETVLNKKRDKYPIQFVSVTECQRLYPYSPFSVYPPHAYIESTSKRGRKDSIYRMPSQSTIVTGIHGGLHNNTAVEMGFEEEEGTYDTEKRTYDRKHIGFLCAGHTAHSEDAGKSRRVCSYTRVRVLSKSILHSLKTASTEVNSAGRWIVYCMGITFNTDLDGIWIMVSHMNECLQKYYGIQFLHSSSQSMMVPPTYMIYYKEKILYISISSGVLLKSVPGDTMLDSAMLYNQQKNPIVEHPCLPQNGPESIRYRYSPFFMMTPYVEHDRPPRTLFASGQTTQGIFFPWSPATARVSPLHASRPMVATQFVRSIEQDQGSNPNAMWDVFAGEDMVVCYMNTGLNYDDSMIVSSKFSDTGGFSTLSLCTYVIPETEDVPEVGEKLCGKRYRWWKVDCISTCVCKGKQNSKLISTSGRIPSGRVKEVVRTEDGHISVKVLSFSQILTGDKISTMHGQKGVARIVAVQDLPIVVTSKGESIIADLYIAVGSIVSRQTNGQVYESEAGLKGAREGRLQTVSEVESTDTEECMYVLNPITGRPIMRQMDSGIVEPVKATYGITRIINQTQMTRERHHLTHNSEGKHSLGTRPGRASGGGVAAAEMDFHAMYSSGLYSCAQELLERGNVCRIPVCRNCKAVWPLHDCGDSGEKVLVNMSFDAAIADMISACVNQSCNRYDVEHL